jgi:transketolase
MNSLSLTHVSNLESRAVRDGWGEGLVELGKINPGVVVLTADVKESTRVEEFAKQFPDRFIECGVAEQNMMGIAAGLAAAGKIPFVSSYAVFSPGRNWDQLRVSVCYSNLHVIVGGHHAGLSVGPDGATHQALEDIAITRVLPNMKVIVPVDAVQAKELTIKSAEMEGPVYIRLFREKSPIISDSDLRFEIEKKQALVIGAGPILNECLIAVKQLQEEGIGVKLLNCYMVKPLDEKIIIEAVKECGAVVTVEDHQIMGGMGSAVAELLAQKFPVPIEFVGVKDSFGESGAPDGLAVKYGLKARDIFEAVKKVIDRKKDF